MGTRLVRTEGGTRSDAGLIYTVAQLELQTQRVQGPLPNMLSFHVSKDPLMAVKLASSSISFSSRTEGSTVTSKCLS